MNGHCHWYFDGKCAVHENAPYGCAFFDSHMSENEIRERYQAMAEARRADAEADGIYYQVWKYLRDRGLVDTSKNRSAMRSNAGRSAVARSKRGPVPGGRPSARSWIATAASICAR